MGRRVPRRAVAPVLAVVTALAVLAGGTTAGCGTRGDSLTVWLMDGSAPGEWLAELNRAFEAEHGIPVDVQVQQWEGIQDRLTTALSEDGTVDVVEIGNTQTTGFAAAGGLAALPALGDEPWQDTLRASTEIGGTPYAVPWYGASPVVVYDRSVWAEAGARVPRTREEWIDALRAVEEHTDAEPIHLPGQRWYVFGGFLADEGGSFAVRDGGTWTGALATDEGEAAMDFYRRLRDFTRAPADADEGEPQQSTEVVPEGEVASWIGLAWEVAAAAEAIEDRGGRADFGFFPVPGKTADRPGHVLLGGSNLAVSGRARHPGPAEAWVRMATSRPWAERFVAAGQGGVVAGRTDAAADPAPDSFAAAMAHAAGSGYLPPLTGGWANVETEPNPVKELMTKALTGEDYRQAARAADAEIALRLNREEQ